MKNYIFTECFKENDELFFPAYVLKVKHYAKFSLVRLRYDSKIFTAALRPSLCAADTALLREGIYADFRCIAMREFHAECGLELNITDFEILSSPAEAPNFSAMDTELSAAEEMREKNRLILRGTQSFIYRISTDIQYAFRDFMVENGFFEVNTPVITSKSERDSFSFDYFGQTAELAFSPQLSLTPCTAAFERVFEISHSFTAKRRGGTRYLNEFTSLNFQIGYIESLNDIINITSRALSHIISCIDKKHGTLLREHGITLPNIGNIPTITLNEAFEILNTPPHADLNPTEAKRLAEQIKSSGFMFVRGFPNGEFYVRSRNGEAQRFELYCNGVKIADGSENISDFSNADSVEAKKYPVYYDTLRYGIMPYGGVMIGLERLVMQLLGLTDIRRAALFPRDVRNLEP